MNRIKLILRTSIFTAFLLLTSSSCESILDEPVYSELDTEALLQTKTGVETVLFEGYSKVANMNSVASQHTNKREEMTTDILTHSDGGENRNAVLLLDFTWDSQSLDEAATYWLPFWQAIRNANIVLENVDRVADVTEDYKNGIKAEARFIRAYAYNELWDQYGSIPLRTSTEDALELPNLPEGEVREFIISEFNDIEDQLPNPGEEIAYGRAHSGAVRAFLTKLYLNSKRWQEAADKAQEIISNGHYMLHPDYNALFALENERNQEFIWVRPALSNLPDARNTMTATALPWGFKTALDGGITGVTNTSWTNYASQYRLRDIFFNSFDENDRRKERILTKYINGAGDTIDLIEDFDNATRSMKFPPDPAATGLNHGNDLPKIRYADILMSRAEALNEINGPTQESIDLINEIRNRAQLDDIELLSFPTKESLRDHIINERAWEFWYEAKRRRDLIRTGKFIEYALNRGVTNAKAYHVWFPIPQYAIDANSLLKQNEGY
jgi:hypothetical protein